jgi:4-amino-4-deoxy-L-arabinose transferase-like glycosyltransferase
MKKYLLLGIIILAAILRLLFLNKFPIGFNADEAAIGYNAYSLIETGRDEHQSSWPLVFRSFDDYKPPLYFYLVLPFVKVLGLNEWSVRLPSAILGIGMVYLIYLLAGEFFPKHKAVSYLAAFIVAISPWSLHFSRGGWEVNVATFLFLLGTYSFVKKKYLFSILAFVASLYTYHSARIIAPLLGLSLFLVYLRQIEWKKLIPSIALGVILTIPVLVQMFSPTGTSRFSGVSIFADSGPLSYVHEMRRLSKNPNSLLTKIRYNRYAAYTGKFISNYFSHFSPGFLFISGDRIDRSRVPGVGQLYLTFLPFLLIGLIYCLYNLKRRPYKLIILWLAIAPIPASLTFQSPHALRAENMIIPLALTIAIGIYRSALYINKHFKKFSITICLLLSLLLTLEFGRYLYQYYVVYPKDIPIAWQYGFRDLAEYVKVNYEKYDKIVISTRYDQPYIFM